MPIKYAVLLALFILVAAIPLVRLIVSRAPVPDGVGIGPSLDGRLAPCLSASNCVSTFDGADPIPVPGNPADVMARVADLIQAAPRTRIVTLRGDYLHAEVRSRIFGFIDDLEVLVPRGGAAIHVRSSSRTGRHDLGVNRARLDALRAAFLSD